MVIHIFHHNPPNKLPTLWGVWLPGEGWLKATKPSGEISACAFEYRREAANLARVLGGHAQYIDDSIASRAVEEKLKSAEMTRSQRTGKLWRILMNWLNKASR
jgi:hypothetical protein